MRTQIKVEDLSIRQWNHLQDAVQDEYDMHPGAVRVCVQFELTAEMYPRHVEMPVRAFVNLMAQLQKVDAEAQTVTAALTPDELEDDVVPAELVWPPLANPALEISDCWYPR